GGLLPVISCGSVVWAVTGRAWAWAIKVPSCGYHKTTSQNAKSAAICHSETMSSRRCLCSSAITNPGVEVSMLVAYSRLPGFGKTVPALQNQCAQTSQHDSQHRQICITLASCLF